MPRDQRSQPSPRVAAAILSLALLLGLGWWLQRSQEGGAPESGGPAQGSPTPEERRDPSSLARPGRHSAAAPRPGQGAAGGAQEAEAAPTPDQDGCLPRAESVCLEGDAWWLDSCERVGEKAMECGSQLCRDGQCQAPDPEGCGPETEFGRCVGEELRSCYAGRTVVLDCAARQQRCVIAEEGATCVPTKEVECDWPAGETVCEGNTLVTCEGGRYWRMDCAAQGAVCDALPSTARFACIQLVSPGDLGQVGAREERVCGPCGCAGGLPEEPRVEICDGQDNDLDGEVDEGAACEPVPVVATVITDARGRSSYTRGDVEAEIQRINAFLADPEGGEPPELALRLVLEEVIELERPQWLRLESLELSQALQDPAVHPVRPAFYLPLLFTDEVFQGGAPVSGLSSLPNGHCGGARRHLGAQPAVGVIALAKGRSPTTAVHEVGHFLGLCHTHESRPAQVQRLVESGSVLRACEDCLLDGDGLCDTPPDPGPELCSYQVPACTVSCQEGDQGPAPDATNIMSYYTACRRLLTPQQRQELRKGLALRRAWHPCLQGEGCACDALEGGCPEQMACKPRLRETGWACSLVGGVAAEQSCHGYGDCQAGSLCLRPPGGEPRCARLCDVELSACECGQVSSGDFAVCREDLR